MKKFECKLNELNDLAKFKSDMDIEQKQRLVQNRELYYAEKTANKDSQKTFKHEYAIRR